jgi:hypothetical protein
MRTARVLLGALGVAAIGYAILGAVADPDVTPIRHTMFLLALVALHDALLLPAFLLAGALLRRIVTGPARAIVQAALVVTAAVTLVAAPLVLGYGRTADNPSALPGDYPAGLTLILAAIWIPASAALVSIRLARRRRDSIRRGVPAPDPH